MVAYENVAVVEQHDVVYHRHLSHFDHDVDDDDDYDCDAADDDDDSVLDGKYSDELLLCAPYHEIEGSCEQQDLKRTWKTTLMPQLQENFVHYH